MKIFSRFVLAGACFCFPFIAGQDAFSQQLKGQYAPPPVVAEEEALDLYIPRVFSSQVKGVSQAEKLDASYYDLTVALQGFAGIDGTYKERLIELIKPYKFQITRRGSEFKKDLDNAMKASKENYGKMNLLTQQFEEHFNSQVSLFSPEDRKIIETVGQQAIQDFKNRAKKYFYSQADFLKKYNNLVVFILDQGGSYYYDSQSKGIAFYRAGSYKYFKKVVDSLDRVNSEQAELLRSMTPGPPL